MAILTQQSSNMDRLSENECAKGLGAVCGWAVLIGRPSWSNHLVNAVNFCAKNFVKRNGSEDFIISE